MSRVRQRELFPDGVLGSGDQNLSDRTKGQAMFDRILKELRAKFDAFA